MRKPTWKVIGLIAALPATAILGLIFYIGVFGLGGLINPGPGLAAVTAAQAGLHLTVIRDGLNHPWSLAFLPDGRFLVSERVGRLSILSQDGKNLTPVTGLPEVTAKGQGGLMDIALDSDFASNNILYFSFAEADPSNDDLAGTALGKARLVESARTARLEDQQILFRQTPKVKGWGHFGSRIVFASDDTLFLTLGERYDYKERAQNLDTTLGKIIRLHKDGTIPVDNPFIQDPNALDTIWSYGHRNIQGAALHPQSRTLWVVEHGPRGGDELNIIAPGKNYGWPIITWGVDYTYAPIGEGTHKAGMEQPLYQWTPSIAPSGMTFVTTDRYPGWQGSLLVGSLAHRRLIRLSLNEKEVAMEDPLLGDLGARIRDVREAPDGHIFILTDDENGRIIRLDPLK